MITLLSVRHLFSCARSSEGLLVIDVSGDRALKKVEDEQDLSDVANSEILLERSLAFILRLIQYSLLSVEC